jgi:hypothetical protein
VSIPNWVSKSQGSCPTLVRGKNTERGLPAEAAETLSATKKVLRVSEQLFRPAGRVTLGPLNICVRSLHVNPEGRHGRAFSPLPPRCCCGLRYCAPRKLDALSTMTAKPSADARRLCVVTARPPSGARRETRTHGLVTPPQPLARERVRSRESNERRPPAPCSA